MYGDSLRQPPAAADAERGGALLAALAMLVCPAWGQPAQNLPKEMHVCWANCFTLTFDHGLYRRTDGTEEWWAVERFTPDLVVLHRHDAPVAWNGFSADVIYRGRVSNDRLTGVTVNGHLVPDIGVSWGFALDSLPGSNAELDRRISAQMQAQAEAQTQSQALPMNYPSVPDAVEPAADVSGSDAPPPLLDYEQAPVPDDGYLWTPGYWGWGGTGYYWVPGAWVQPPRMGVLWTPGYWAYVGAIYVFHAGYWGPHVGFYGGINYGYGYGGSGFAGGRWVGNSLAYNRAVSNVNATVVHNMYAETVVGHATVSKVSYNGGPGGTSAIPTAQERAAAAEPHMPSTPRQRQIVQLSARNPALKARAFVDRPVVAATIRPAAVSAPGVVGTHKSAAPAISGRHDQPQAPPSTALHPQSDAARVAAPRTAAYSQSDAEHPATPGPTDRAQGDAPHPATVRHSGETPARPQAPSSK